ncbi:MAG TPA: hypothetical protein VNL16_06465 [Chloroflexota bacterium]|nr:hypothetical protein [Chloroflexota bacterium]
MKPAECIQKLRRLIGFGRLEEAIEFSNRIRPLLRAQLSVDQRNTVGRLVEFALMGQEAQAVGPKETPSAPPHARFTPR